MAIKRKIFFVVLGAVLGIYVIGALGVMFAKQRAAADGLPSPSEAAPSIEFSCDQTEAVDLRTVRCRVRMEDETALDYSTYRMRLLEIGEEYDLPVEGGLIGRDYESSINLGWLASRTDVTMQDQLTVEFSVADDQGHATTVRRVLPLR
jgi:hypothetical protein